MGAPCGHTCPDIDKALSCLCQVIDILEDLRSSNSDLRDWEEEQERRADAVWEECLGLRDSVTQLEAELSEVDALLTNLRNPRE